MERSRRGGWKVLSAVIVRRRDEVRRHEAEGEISPIAMRPFSYSFLARRIPIAGCALVAAACGRPGRLLRVGGGDTAYVGVAVGLDSPDRYVTVFKGVELALDQLNAHRPAGAPVLAMRRAPEHATSAVEVAAAFRDDPSVVGVVGHTESAATISAAPIYGDRAHDGAHALVAVAPTAAATLVTRLNDWVFRVCPTATEQARALARYAADSAHVASLAILYRNEPAGTEYVRAFENEYRARGGTTTEHDPFMEEIPEFDAYARRLAQRHTRAALVYGNVSTTALAMAAFKRAGIAPLVLANNPPQGDDAASTRVLAGMRYTALYAADAPASPAAARFAQAYQAKVGSPPDHWAALGYDAATLIGDAVQAVGTDRRRVRDWVAAVGRSAPPLEGATGTIRFDEHGDPIDKPVLVREVGGGR